ncbi:MULTISPECIES: serine hydrolase domain-containing protein [Aneurinibacillus]|uniref:Beta-lactamase n=2 Tax=Aneurinibacillus thermoaerophilus TaxID=143495 RepID=A0A1G8FIS8_ANETH|nr:MULTISPECIES: serine hydrolase domain-containing protein [Aneurinibacillus]AMA73027.1 hypothetical protein ACH33_09250 [Aneurinibacillus sp. XH2]MED0677471.1 serine hydrolase [Aneurinibacillus thermoaerophilus]MED0735879.1 serine hydrolase [Aneurinibacillus thermoaerophilus]MED0759137.1 serine hydrolase [Aneurinibacillus thermoaerophilus]MED0762657.1 serine hydrolase [Aneurinibacillus thermoaerophilus]
MVKGGCIIKVFITGIIIIEFLTLFRIGSVSKSLTATLIMRLVQEGILDLNVPIHTYIHEFTLQNKEDTRSITLCMLLSHTAGFPDGGDIVGETMREII